MNSYSLTFAHASSTIKTDNLAYLDESNYTVVSTQAPKNNNPLTDAPMPGLVKVRPSRMVPSILVLKS